MDAILFSKQIRPWFFCFYIITLVSCNTSVQQGSFTIMGNIKHAPAQKVYLEEVYFDDRPPLLIDSAKMQNGRFQLTGTARESGLYLIRLEKDKNTFLFINDHADLLLHADLEKKSIADVNITGPANQELKKLLLQLEIAKRLHQKTGDSIQKLKSAAGSDSLTERLNQQYSEEIANIRKIAFNMVDSSSYPVVSIFALGFLRDISPELLTATVNRLQKRFPEHNAVATVVKNFNNMLAQQQSSAENSPGPLAPGNKAPDFTLPDPDGKPFSLHELKGKFVLIDFWASWCGPCRAENPHVVAAFQKYKKRNFTVLGVSLDNEKDAWKSAIQKDQLSWKHVSQLKGWESEITSTYGFNAIPFNVLIDPQGKILAIGLQGDDLSKKLEEVLP